MSSVPNQMQFSPNPVPCGVPACEGRKSITTIIDFSLGLSYTLDLSAIQAQLKMINSVQTLYVDNYGNTSPVTLTMGVTLQRIIIPAGAQGYFPILQPNPPVLNFTNSAGNKITIQILNFFLPPYIWNGAFNFTPAGYLEVSDVALDALISGGALKVSSNPIPLSTLTDDSGTIAAGGTAQSVIAANPSRKRFIISNPLSATEELDLLLGGAGVGAITLAPGMTWDENGPTCFAGAVFLKAATTGHAFTAFEG